MIRSLALLPLLALAACGGDKSDDTAAGDSGTSESCTITVTTTPSSDAVNAYYRGNIEFRLSAADTTATIETDIPGSQSLSADGKTVIWTPSAPLSPSTAYSATLHYCGGDAVLNFTTSELGSDVASGTDLVGKAFALDLLQARIVQPAGIGAVLSQFLTQDILVGVEAVSGNEIQMIGAIGADGASTPTQNYCDPTIPFPAADFSQAPFFSIGPADTTLSVAGFDITIGQLNITGTIAPDASYFGGGTLSGTIDTRPLAPLLDDSGNPGAICDLAVSFGVTCEPCGDGEPYCLNLVADQIVATGVTTGPIVEVAGADCTACDTWTASNTPDVADQVCPEPAPAR